MKIMLKRERMFVIYIGLLNRLLLLSSSLNVFDCGIVHSQVTGNSAKRTAASNRLIQQGHLAVSQSNTAIELLEMKERLCAGFMFKASGINCTFQIPPQSVSIFGAFGECKTIMINRCRRKQREFFCEKGKQNALKLNKHTPIISRQTDRFDVSTIDCFLPDQDRFIQVYGSVIQSYSKCCSVCQKGKLFAIELSTCKHKFYNEPILDETFNDCCYSRLYQTKFPNDYLINNDDQYKGFTASKLTSQLITQFPSQDPSQDNFILDNSGLINNALLTKSQTTNNLINGLVNSDQKSNHQLIQLINRISNMFLNQLNSNSNSNLLSIDTVIDKNSFNPNSNKLTSKIKHLRPSMDHSIEILQELQLNVDVEKIYLSKARLMLNLKRNETLIANLTNEERNLLLKALDTSKLDYTISKLTDLIQNNNSNSNRGFNLDLNLSPNKISNLDPSSTNSILLSNLKSSLPNSSIQNDLQNELLNRLLTGSSYATSTTATNLMEPLQLLLATKWINNSTVDHYSNLPIQEENLSNSSFLDDDDILEY